MVRSHRGRLAVPAPSGRGGVIATVPPDPALVVTTPGAEPVAAGGYAAALLLDGWALLGRPSLRAAEEALRRWMNAAALVRGAADGGTVIVLADAGLAAVQALIRWDAVTHSEREYSERAQLGFPPAVRMAAITGPDAAVRDLLAAAELPELAEVLGPVATDGGGSPGGHGDAPVAGGGAAGGGAGGGARAGDAARALIRVPRPGGAALARALQVAQAVRSAHKEPGAVRVQLDPPDVI